MPLYLAGAASITASATSDSKNVLAVSAVNIECPYSVLAVVTTVGMNSMSHFVRERAERSIESF